MIFEQHNLNESVTIDQDVDMYIFDRCRKIKSPQIFQINTQLNCDGIQIQFNDADGPIIFQQIIINEHGDFRSCVQNGWWNGYDGPKSDSGDYSLLSLAKKIQIIKNQQAIRDLWIYIKGKYEFTAQYWKHETLGKEIELTITQSEKMDQEIIENLKKYFRNVIII